MRGAVEPITTQAAPLAAEDWVNTKSNQLECRSRRQVTLLQDIQKSCPTVEDAVTGGWTPALTGCGNQVLEVRYGTPNTLFGRYQVGVLWCSVLQCCEAAEEETAWRDGATKTSAQGTTQGRRKKEEVGKFVVRRGGEGREAAEAI